MEVFIKDFSLKFGIYSHLNMYMKLYEHKRSRLFLALLYKSTGRYYCQPGISFGMGLGFTLLKFYGMTNIAATLKYINKKTSKILFSRTHCPMVLKLHKKNWVHEDCQGSNFQMMTLG